LATGHVQEAKNTSFELASRNLGMAPEAVRAGKLLDAALESQNMSVDETGYFNILVNVFSQGLRSDDNIHLKEFVFIVPALIINAVEAMVRAKSKFSKRTRSSADALFTDDGFVMGLAYVLKVLGQDKHFNSLYWFDSLRKYYKAERARLEEGLDMDNIANGLMGLQIWSQKLASVSEEDAHNIQMAAKRVSAYLMELELIEFNFSGARIFFL
jgi:WASH complex subunit 7